MNKSVDQISWLGSSLRYLDQTALPLEEVYRTTTDYRQVIAAIKKLEIRGAPLIGIAAAYATVLAANSIGTGGDLFQSIGSVLGAIDEIGSARPTAVNLQWACERMAVIARECPTVSELVPHLLAEAKAIHEDDRMRCLKIGEYGASLVAKPSSVLTHCNAGALATGGIGTAIGVILTAFERGNISMVYMDETRPLLQGARLTAWEMQKAGIPATLLADNMAASLMAQGKIDFVITGADRIAANGDSANKIGTYGLAVLARHHNIPFYIAAPTSTIDPSLPDGSGIPIEFRDPGEVTNGFGRRTAPEGVNVYSPAFDVTPAALITAIITDEGVHHPPYHFASGT